MQRAYLFINAVAGASELLRELLRGVLQAVVLGEASGKRVDEHSQRDRHQDGDDEYLHL